MATLTLDLPEIPRPQAAYRLAADCPRCGAPLVLRQNRQTGVLFTGCSAYPGCAFAEPHDPRVQTLSTAVVQAVQTLATQVTQAQTAAQRQVAQAQAETHRQLTAERAFSPAPDARRFQDRVRYDRSLESASAEPKQRYAARKRGLGQGRC